MGEPLVNINGIELIGITGQSILELALANDIEIPNLCHDPRLKPGGSCRLCVVDVEGQKGPVCACTFQIEPGMIVKTETEEIRAIRKTILELLFYEHRGACTTCDENGNCKLQRYAYEYQLSDDIFQQPAGGEPLENYTTGNEALEYDPNKCIRCGRCIRICEEVQADSALTFKSRAASVEVTTAFDIPLNDSTCELCGQCISSCPTGALYERAAKGKGQCKDLMRTRTTCPYCGVGCQIDLNISTKTGRIVRVTSEVGCIPNNGNLCVKGRFGMDFIASDKRLTDPLIKRNGKFVKATWEEAIDFVVSKLTEIQAAHGPDSIAGLSSAKCTNEDNYVFQKFIRACIGTNNVDHCARLCHASTVAGLARAFGSGAMTNSIDEIKNAACIFVIGSNTTEAHPVIGLYIKGAVMKNGAELVVADPRRIDLTRFAKLYIAQKPGTDVALVNAMMNVIISEELYDKAFIEERTEDFEKLESVLKDFTPEKAEAITTIPAEKIRTAARIYAKADTASIIYSMGITQHTTGTDNVLSLANLAMLTGNVGKASTGVNPLRGQNNVQGACDLGALPNVYPGYQSVEDSQLQAKFESAWGQKLSGQKGLTVVEMMHAVEEDKIRALYIMGENPALSDPNLNRTRKALEKAEFLVVQDIFLSETAEYADVVLPSVCFAEKDGTYTNTERRVQRVRKAVAPPGQARVDWEIVCDVATKMGYPMGYEGADKIMDEIAAVTPIYGGMSFERIDSVGLQWPCLDKNHPGTKFLHEGTFKRGKGKFHPVEFKAADELPDEKYPFVLSTGRQLYQFHTGTMTRKSAVINQVSPTGYVEIHPDDAAGLEISSGDNVEVSTRRGKVTTLARVTGNIEKGWLFMPFHFREGPANMLTNDALDPTAKIPEFKVCAAALNKTMQPV
ncbi:MAG: formate dehydrogenase [Phycisphaerae bacterium SM1_79]|nr:MAG: formate dehydrogenase [Phycisphaerae bacterium SM1_79]